MPTAYITPFAVLEKDANFRASLGGALGRGARSALKGLKWGADKAILGPHRQLGRLDDWAISKMRLPKLQARMGNTNYHALDRATGHLMSLPMSHGIPVAAGLVGYKAMHHAFPNATTWAGNAADALRNTPGHGHPAPPQVAPQQPAPQQPEQPMMSQQPLTPPVDTPMPPQAPPDQQQQPPYPGMRPPRGLPAQPGAYPYYASMG